MNFRWFFSSKVRDLTDAIKQVRKLYNHQRDILPPPALDALTAALAEAETTVKNTSDPAALDQQIAKLEETASKWIKPYPNAGLRENIEVFLVAIVVAMGIRTFFLQPFKIPTGSMEPTLFGIEVKDLRDKKDFKMPDGLERFWDMAYYGEGFNQLIAPADGTVVGIGRLQPIFGFINRQEIVLQLDGQPTPTHYTIYCGPETDQYGRPGGFNYGMVSTSFKKGDPILQCEEQAGDHLFVDRISYNFRHPSRGEIVVFKTLGIEGIPDQTAFYIKRMIGLPGESISIGDDQHVRIDGRRLDASTPHFQNVYGFDTNAPRREGKFGQWNGHLLDMRSNFQTPSDHFDLPADGYFVMGDNTMNSLDSRFWGKVPEHNIIGKSFFVYWPFTQRFGWNNGKY